MDITLYEKINKDKLKQVLECSNIPFDKTDDESWKKAFITSLVFYNKKKVTKNGLEIKYKQVHKYGRYYTKCGLQTFQKDVRKYISGEYYNDLDFKKCHHKIIQDLFLQNDIQESVILREYINNTEEFLEQNNTTKDFMIKLINKDTCSNVKFQKLHEKIYKKLVPILIKDNKVLYDRIKKQRVKEKKLYNYDGSFFAHYLQNIENDGLMIMYNYFNSKGYVAGSLMFDGLYVEKCESNIQDEFETIQKLIKDELNFHFEIVQKSTETKWIPKFIQPELVELNKTTETQISQKFSIETFMNLSIVKEKNEDGQLEINAEKMSEFMNYANKFICLFEEPHCYGWRDNCNKEYNMRTNAQIVDRTDVSALGLWKHSDLKNQYERMVFTVNSSDLKDNVYNRYVRPPVKKCETDIELQCPVFFDFLRRVIADNDESVFLYIINYISKMIQVGMTGQAIVLMGEMGTGKSTLCEILVMLVGEKYHQTLNDIHQMDSQFNSLAQTTIITIVEEVVNNGGDFHKINSKMKSMITDKHIMIQKKGIDQFMDLSNNNLFICSNGNNPIHLTVGNRRVCVICVKKHEQRNGDYFSRLRKEVNENIEYIRHFFFTFKFVNDLNSIRPTTKAELTVKNLNRTSVEFFIEECLVLKGPKTHSSRKSSYIYEQYLAFCRQTNSKVTGHKYFRPEVEKFFGIEFLVTKTGNFVQGYINEDLIVNDVDEDEEY